MASQQALTLIGKQWNQQPGIGVKISGGVQFPSSPRPNGAVQEETMDQGSNGNGKVDKVQDAVRMAHEELRTLLQQRAELTKRIGTVKQNIAVLANMFGEGALNEDLLKLLDRRVTRRQSGFTNACRLALMESRHPATAREVCGQVQQKAAGVLKKHKDPLASV